MKRSIISLIVLLLSAATAHAGPAWYAGPVDRVSPFGSDGSFLVTLENGVLNDCMHNYAYFYVGQLGLERVKNAYAIALTSITTGKEMGIVIDKTINGSGGNCHATGMTADLRK